MTPPPNLSPADKQRLQEWLDWYATRQPEPMPVDELPALLRDVAEGEGGGGCGRDEGEGDGEWGKSIGAGIGLVHKR